MLCNVMGGYQVDLGLKSPDRSCRPLPMAQIAWAAGAEPIIGKMRSMSRCDRCRVDAETLPVAAVGVLISQKPPFINHEVGADAFQDGPHLLTRGRREATERASLRERAARRRVLCSCYAIDAARASRRWRMGGTRRHRRDISTRRPTSPS